MAIIVEDGSIVADSNSFVSEVELSTYAINRGVTLSGDTDSLLLKATDYLETLNYKGNRYTKDQSLQWPRSNVSIDGFSVDVDEIPEDLKTAQLALALEIDAGNDPLAPVERATKREKVDVIEIEYMDGTRDSTYAPSYQRYLNKLISGGSSGLGVVGLVRA